MHRKAIAQLAALALVLGTSTAAMAGQAQTTLRVRLVVLPVCQVAQANSSDRPVVNCSQAVSRVERRAVTDIPRAEREEWAKAMPASPVAGVWEVMF